MEKMNFNLIKVIDTMAMYMNQNVMNKLVIHFFVII